MNERSQTHLRIVDERQAPSHAKQGQLSFGFEPDTFVMTLANISNIPEQDFLQLLRRVSPDAVVDLRVVPRFDFGRLSRRAVFRMFEDLSARYHDLPHSIGAKGHRDARLNPEFVAAPLGEFLARAPCSRRALVLLNDAAALDHSLRVLPERLQPQPRGGWHVRAFADF
jgi:hypothetical protein